jgi:hypothetical protein
MEMNLDRRKAINVTELDKENFLKSVLTDRPFEEEVSLMNGALLLKLRAMTVQENADVSAQVKLDRKASIAEETDSYYITLSTYRLALCLVSINGEQFSDITKASYKPKNETETYVAARARLCLTWHTAKLAAYLDAFGSFDAKLIKLSSEVQSPNFWTASA